uniref:hypothetical protein n=1 Tax=Macromonas nakdongensis TaxID=1843082 RepID=UPI0012FEC1AC
MVGRRPNPRCRTGAGRGTQAGHRYQAEWQSGRYRTEQGRTPFVRWDASANQVFSHGPHTWNAYLRVGRPSAVPPGAADKYSLGGFQ